MSSCRKVLFIGYLLIGVPVSNFTRFLVFEATEFNSILVSIILLLAVGLLVCCHGLYAVIKPQPSSASLHLSLVKTYTAVVLTAFVCYFVINLNFLLERLPAKDEATLNGNKILIITAPVLVVSFLGTLLLSRYFMQKTRQLLEAAQIQSLCKAE
mmetsp:Transcript_29081/g.52049  ORF Transcript_29081/g.52049 Transcript_29081/m.52049 type:complete len:155 (+) Transcript_29081:67-531(+)